jgi:hypothetical protein
MRIGLLFTIIIFTIVPSLSMSAQRDSAIIRNSGSTNTSGYTITVWSDATGSVEVAGKIDSSFVLPGDLNARFFTELHAASASTDAAPEHHCMKSASFGTRTTVQWHGWNSPDLQCPPLSPSLGALASDVNAIESAAGISGGPRRIGLPPSLRKIPPATPEVQPT